MSSFLSFITRSQASAIEACMLTIIVCNWAGSLLIYKTAQKSSYLPDRSGVNRHRPARAQLDISVVQPVLAVEASDNSLNLWWKGKFSLDEYNERLKVVPNVEIARIEDAGHMMHHDQPQVLAALIERFIA